MYFYMGQDEECTGQLYCCHYLTSGCLFCGYNALSNVCNICIVLQVVSVVQPKGIKVSKDQDADKENKSEKVFIPFSAIRKFY